jgi:hypothetical protein
MCRDRHGTSRMLRRGRSSCGDAPYDGARRQPAAAGFRSRRHQCKSWRVNRRHRPVNRLVAQMADGAGCFGRAGVVMPDDASKRHADQQQREERYRNRQIPIWPSRSHAARDVYGNPSPDHIADVGRVQWVAPAGVLHGRGCGGRIVRALLVAPFALPPRFSSTARAPFPPARRISPRACAAGRRFPAGVRAA